MNLTKEEIQIFDSIVLGVTTSIYTSPTMYKAFNSNGDLRVEIITLAAEKQAMDTISNRRIFLEKNAK